MDTINIIGRGNVASHLFLALKDKYRPIIVNPHTLDELDRNAPLTIIAVSDSAIRQVIDRLPALQGIVVHTSGSTDISVFYKSCIQKFGVLYPMQTFSKEKKLNYSKIPFFIEASESSVLSKIKGYAASVSDNVREASSDQRKKLHIAAVLSCNFVNHLWALTDDYLKKQGLQFSDMIPLIKETVGKIEELSPKDAQTGPASRGDKAIINEHLEALSSDNNIKEIYRILSDSIMSFEKCNENYGV